jgi:putative tryptophan/tyrosine transport system substrate-binding protein
MAIKVARRKFISALGIVVAWPRTARAQTRRRLGLLFATSAQAAKARGLLEAVTQGLKEYGWVEGQNITFEYRFADGKEEVLPKLAAELVQLPMDAILTDGTPATQAAKKATRTVPIVMAVSNDPVASGFVASLNRPGGNITGTSLLAPDLAGRRLQLLTEMVPGLAHVAVLMSAPPSTGGNHRHESLRLQLLPARAFILLPLPQPDHHHRGSLISDWMVARSIQSPH